MKKYLNLDEYNILIQLVVLQRIETWREAPAASSLRIGPESRCISIIWVYAVHLSGWIG